MSSRAGTVRLTGYIDVPENRLAATREALPTHVELTRNEPGCLSFNVKESRERVGRFEVSETFVDQAAFDAHQARTQVSEWAIVTKDIPRNYVIKVDEG